MVRLTHAHTVDTRPFSRVGRGLGTRLCALINQTLQYSIISLSYKVILQSSTKLKLSIFVYHPLVVQNCNSSSTSMKAAGVITPYQLDHMHHGPERATVIPYTFHDKSVRINLSDGSEILLSIMFIPVMYTEVSEVSNRFTHVPCL